MYLVVCTVDVVPLVDCRDLATVLCGLGVPVFDAVAYVISAFILRVAIETECFHGRMDLSVVVHLARVCRWVDLGPLPLGHLLREVPGPRACGRRRLACIAYLPSSFFIIAVDATHLVSELVCGALGQI
jgi:hypothetical protein